MKVLVCGGRNWDSYIAVHDALASILKDRDFKRFVVIEGGAKGADAYARLATHELGLDLVTVPAEWDKYGRRAGPIRNQKMLEMEPDLVLAFPMPDSVGTWDMVRRARKAGVEVRVIPEEGGAEHGQDRG